MYKFKMELSDDSPDEEKLEKNNSTVRFVLVVSDYPEIVESIHKSIVPTTNKINEDSGENSISFK